MSPRALPPFRCSRRTGRNAGRVLGAQAIGQGDAAKRIDVVATAIKFGAVVDDLRDLELCYAPPFSNAKDPVNVAALVAGNLLGGDYRSLDTDHADVFAFERTLGEERLVVLLIFGGETREVGEVAGGETLLSSLQDAPPAGSDLRPNEARIVRGR